LKLSEQGLMDIPLVGGSHGPKLRGSFFFLIGKHSFLISLRGGSLEFNHITSLYYLIVVVLLGVEDISNLKICG